MPKYGYLVVEGPHDVEFVYRLLRPYQLERVKMIDDVDQLFRGLIPASFPHEGDLQKRVPVPLFLRSQSHVIAVHSAGGDSRLTATVEETMSLRLKADVLTGIGILLDSDKEIPAAERYQGVRTAMEGIKFRLPELAGQIAVGTPRLGAFVLPDNSSIGNLEDLLLECASSAYPELLESARKHVDVALAQAAKLAKDGEDLSKRPYRNKAIVGAVASVLRPGKAVQTSIQDNQWLKGDRLQLDKVKAVQDFLKNLFELA
jgi:hypothetical protein